MTGDRRMMRRIVCLVLLMLLLLSGTAECALPGEADWTMRPEELLAVLGPETEVLEDSVDGLGTMTILTQTGGSVADIACDKRTFVYLDGEMAFISCFPEKELADEQQMIDAITQQYGAAQETMKLSLVEYMAAMLSDATTLAKWSVDENTEIRLYSYEDDGQLETRYEIRFVNPPVYEPIEGLTVMP